jgi:hypothetical protein
MSPAATAAPPAVGPLLPSQSIDLTVPDPWATEQLGLPLYRGAGYRADLRTWSLLPAGGFLRFHLCLPAPVPVQWTPTLAAGLVGGRINCPISITVNGKPLVASYAETSASFHPVTWVIPASLLAAGNNTIQMTLLGTATTPLFINHVGIANAVLPTQAIDLTVADPAASAQLALPRHRGAGYRDDFETWALLGGGALRFHLCLSRPIPVQWTPTLAAALLHGRAHCPLSITVNGRTFLARHTETDANFHPVSWILPARSLRAGNNQIVMALLDDATTQLFLSRVTVTG